MEGKLTQQEQIELIGVVDNANEDDYDQEFYEKMKEILPLGVDEVDDRVRRAIFRYIAEGEGKSSKSDNGAYVMMGFIHGYMVGRKLRRDIRR